MSNDEAYALAMDSPEPGCPVIGAGRWMPASAVKLVTLGEAWELHGWSTRDALAKAVQRAQIEHRGLKGNAKLYDVRDLRAVQGRP